MWGESLTSLFVRGGLVMWPLLICSILALAVALERAILFLWTAAPFQAFVDRLRDALARGGPAAAQEMLQTERAPLARVAETYLANLGLPPELREEVVGREASQRVSRLEKRLNWLSIIGHLAPMIGLLGTVLGLVKAFHQIELLGGQVQPGDLASGIWIALLTTVFGLTVALPALAAHHFLDHRAAAVALQMQWLVTYLNEWFAPRPVMAASVATSETPAETTNTEAKPPKSAGAASPNGGPVAAGSPGSRRDTPATV